jgi:hypothetical protein
LWHRRCVSRVRPYLLRIALALIVWTMLTALAADR